MLWQEGVVITVVVLSGISNGLGGLPEKKRGEEIVNTEQTKHHKT